MLICYYYHFLVYPIDNCFKDIYFHHVQWRRLDKGNVSWEHWH